MDREVPVNSMVRNSRKGYYYTVVSIMDMKAVRNLTYISQVAFIMLTPIIGCIFLGNWLDEKLGTSPWILMFGVIIGVGTAFVSLYKFVMSVTREKEEKTPDYVPNSKEKQDE